MTSRLEAPWWGQENGFFGPDYLIEYRSVLPHGRTLNEVEFLARKLCLLGDTLLDMPCGHGRHSIEFARMGCRVTGVDLNAFFLDEARKVSARTGYKVEFRFGDMRQHYAELDNLFDVGVNLFTALGYFDSEEDDCAIIRNFYRALKSNGKFVIDYFNHDWAMRNFKKSNSERLPDNSLILTERTYDPIQNRNVDHRTRIKNGNVVHETRSTLRLYTARDLIRMAETVGFVFKEAYGDFNGGPLTIDSKRMILFFRK